MKDNTTIAVRADTDARALYGTAPVPGPVPAGTDVRDAAEFEQLESEVRRMDANGPAAVDWHKVSTLSLNILANQSKDILVACWASYGLFRTEGYQGLAVGLAILRGMVDVHWDGLFPPIKRERARVGAIDWLVGRLDAAVAANAPTEAEFPAVVAAYETLGDLDRQLGVKLVNEQAALGGLFRALRSHCERASREMAAAENSVEADCRAQQPASVTPQSSLPADSAQPAAPARAVPAGPDSDWAGFMERLPDMLRQAAAALRVASPAEPKAYLLNRIGSWMRFDALPPDAAGRTKVFPPVDNIAALEAKVAAGQHADVVDLAEEITWSGPFWLDAHRRGAKALESMGASFTPAAAAVRAALTLLVTRYPPILALHFSDGRPFADPETRAWVAMPAKDASRRRDPVDQTIAEAHKLIGAEQPQAALERLSRALDFATGERARFVGQLAQARFCIETGFVTTAVSLLEHLEAVTAERNLQSWEPALALDAAELRFRAMAHCDLQHLIDEPRRRVVLDQIRTRVAAIDIARASQLGRY